MDEVNKFLKRFHTSDDIDTVFTSRASYWFAYILYRRFIRDGAEIMYSDVNNHFGTRIRGKVYDITGDVTKKYTWRQWLLLNLEADEKERIMRDYIMFQSE